MKSWILDIKEDTDTGDFYIQLTDEILQESGLSIGDHLHWIDNHDGSWTIVKEEDLTNFIKKGIM